MIYNKLVRDNIPNILDKKNIKFKTHIADNLEYYIKLKEKLIEETNEFLKSDNTDELADILEVIDSICNFWKIKKSNLQKTKLNKAKQRGSFNKKIILEEA